MVADQTYGEPRSEGTDDEGRTRGVHRVAEAHEWGDDASEGEPLELKVTAILQKKSDINGKKRWLVNIT